MINSCGCDPGALRCLHGEPWTQDSAPPNGAAREECSGCSQVSGGPPEGGTCRVSRSGVPSPARAREEADVWFRWDGHGDPEGWTPGIPTLPGSSEDLPPRREP